MLLKNFLATGCLAVLLGFVLVGEVIAEASISAPEPETEESVCFDNLVEQAGNSSIFSKVDFTKLVKSNGPDGNLVNSKEFSANTYKNFKKYSKSPVPLTKEQIKKFPNKLWKVPERYLQWPPSRGVYKQNRTNVLFLVGRDSRQTKIGDPNNDGVPDHIKGYYVNSRVLTFGRQSDLMFPFPSRKAAATPGRAFPFGRPYVDMREYIIFSQHLSSRFGNKFIGCGIAKATPEGEYALSSWEGEKSINPFNYGGQVMEGSDMSTRVLSDRNGYRFRATDVRIQTNAKEVRGGQVFYDNPLMHYDALVLAYDNGSSFYNEFITHKIITEVANRPANQNNGVDFVKNEEIRALKNRTNLRILNGGSQGISAFNPSSLLMASIIPNVLASSEQEDAYNAKFSEILDAEEEPELEENSSWEGIGVQEGEVSFETMDKIEKIKDVSLKAMLKMAITPGYQEYFEAIPESERTAFHKNYLEHPLNFKEKLENVNYVLENADNIELLTPQNLKFKDISFGGSVIPVEDIRVREVLSKSYLKNEEKQFLEEKKKKLEALQITDDMDILEKQSIIDQRNKIHNEYLSKISKLYNFEDKYKDLKVDYLDLKVQKEVGRITDVEFEASVKLLHNALMESSKRIQLRGVLSETLLNELSNDLLERNLLDKTKNKILTSEKIKKAEPLWKNAYYIMSFVLFIIAVIFALFGVKTIREDT